MATHIARTDTSLVGVWWWTVDRWILTALLTLVTIGVLMSLSASPAIAEQLKLDSFFFVKRQLVYAIVSSFIMIAVSLLTPTSIRRFSLILFIVSSIFVIMTLFVGEEIKGASRWLSFAGFSFQPSEFLKPSFVVLSAWMFAEKRMNPEMPGAAISFFLYVLVVGLLLLQPDLGMAVLTTGVWLIQFFLAGLSIFWIIVAIVFGTVGMFAAYFFLPHVAKRVDQFLDPANSDKFGESYQISQSLEAFTRGGFMGQGPGEGIVKKHLPDSHADFVFAVMGEEFGLVVCMLVASIILFIVVRALARLINENNLFVLLAVSGLVVEFCLQSMINMASTINLIPTKGMTLPFISYGGSSMLAIAIAMGMILALTRRRVDIGYK